LCYGDSLTWGYIPDTNHQRHLANVRWPGVLQDLLGNNYEVIEEGLNSRTLISNDPRSGKEGRSGREYLIPCLDTHDPIDLVILLLGGNELKDIYQMSAKKIGEIVEKEFVQIILNRKSQFLVKTPKLLLIPPPIMDLSKKYAYDRFANSAEKNKKLVQIFKKIAQENSCLFLDVTKRVTVGADGVHLNGGNQKKLAKAIAAIIINSSKDA